MNFLRFLARSKGSLPPQMNERKLHNLYQGTATHTFDLINSCHSAWMWGCTEQSFCPLKICYFLRYQIKQKARAFDSSLKKNNNRSKSWCALTLPSGSILGKVHWGGFAKLYFAIGFNFPFLLYHLHRPKKPPRNSNKHIRKQVVYVGAPSFPLPRCKWSCLCYMTYDMRDYWRKSAHVFHKLFITATEREAGWDGGSQKQ